MYARSNSWIRYQTKFLEENMASVQEYLKRRTDQELRGALISYCMGVMDITVDSAFLI